MNELKPLSYFETELIIEYLSTNASYGKPMEFVHPTLGPLYVEHITYAPYHERDFVDYVKQVEGTYFFVNGGYWGHTFRVVVIAEKESHFRSAYYLKEPKVFTIQELQQLGIVGFEYPEDILEIEFDDDDDE
ncbi:MAG: hypothetical protein H7257_01550 [Taibaiella sp.]|nr:hypothetical protein [Taibaiella sp.]